MERKEIKKLIKTLKERFPEAYEKYVEKLKEHTSYCDALYVFRNLQKSKAAVQQYAMQTVKISITDDAFADITSLQKALENVMYYHEKILHAHQSQALPKPDLVLKESENASSLPQQWKEFMNNFKFTTEVDTLKSMQQPGGPKPVPFVIDSEVPARKRMCTTVVRMGSLEKAA